MKILRCCLFVLLLFALASAYAETPGIAGESDMTAVIDLATDGLTPVLASLLQTGTYPAAVDVSSSMFKVVGCDLVVAGDQMTARLHMKSDAYTYMFPGSAEDAVRADPTQWISLDRTEGDFVFDLPVSALDAVIECAAFSERKQLWYPRTLLVRSDSLPTDAWAETSFATAASLSLEDGTYLCEVSLSGAGRAALVSPATLTVKSGVCTADIVFTTKKIDYVIVDGTTISSAGTENGAAFTVPVTAFDLPLGIIVDSTAIKPSVEVPYTMVFDSSSLKRE
ncbi:MAG: hypothetical protein IJ719_03475 [Clostridia bacterium]|nr:hypothetical protein [Clostridia bacterium]